LIPEKSVMPLPSSRLRRNGRNRWNRKALLGLLSSSSLGLAILGGLAFDQLPAAGRSRLGAEPAARSRVAAQPGGARARLVAETAEVEELPAPQGFASSRIRGGAADLLESADDVRETTPKSRSAGRVRLVSDEEFAPEAANEAETLESDDALVRRRAIPAALELPAQRRERVRQVQYKEEGYVPELPDSTESTTSEMADDESNGPQIRPDATAEAELEAPPESSVGETAPALEAATPSPEPAASEAVADPEPAPSPADAIPTEESLPADSAEVPAANAPAIEPEAPVSETGSPAAEAEPPSQYSDADENALAQEGLSIQPEGAKPTEPKALTLDEICRKYQPKPIGAVGISVKPTKPGAFPQGKDAPAGFCFPKETENVGQFGWYDNCPYGNYLFICHGPLYFEEVDAERYGETWGAWLQPSVTAGKFFGTVPMVPYKWFANTFSEEQWGQDNFGQARNGYAEGRFIPPFHAGAAAFTGGLVTGLFFLIP
jgi:hypothetical protein